MKKMVKDRIAALRAQMQANGIDMYLIGSEDFHGSEYVGEHFKCRAYISGFTGSAGTVVVSKDEAGLWTDGRYFLQAADQLKGSGVELFKMGEEGVPDVRTYICDHIQSGECLGFDGRTVNARAGQDYMKVLGEKGAAVNGKCDLVGEIWSDRPAMSCEPAWLLDIRYAGETREVRIEKIRQEMKKKGADWFVLTSLDDIAWLLNVRGNDVMMSQDSLKFYVSEQVFSAEDKATLEAAGICFYPYHQFYDDLAQISEGQTVLYDGSKANYAIVERLPEHVKVIDDENPTLLPKAIKNPVEVANIREAHIKDGVALTKFMYWLKQHVGKEAMTEISVADKMESFRKQQEHYLQPSFEPICGYAKHAAIVHYSATPETDAAIEAKGMLLMDTGAQYLEGTTDITRTFVVGDVTEEEKKFFTLVLKGNLNLGGAKFLHGCRGFNLDYLAREPLWQIGVDYNHGTGHGVGYLLNVHEGPNGFRWRAQSGKAEGCVLEEGMVTSNEPGFYLENKFGIRHENLVVCRKAEKNAYGQFMCFETLTMVPFDLDGVEPSLLSEREKQLLNDYHKKIYDTIGPKLTEEERTWLAHATRAI
jgi:Xaa-Pro aminopeptidase